MKKTFKKDREIYQTEVDDSHIKISTIEPEPIANKPSVIDIRRYSSQQKAIELETIDDESSDEVAVIKDSTRALHYTENKKSIDTEEF